MGEGHAGGQAVGLAGVVLIGIAAQWIAWRTRLPSILLLLLFGLVAGPITGFIRPDDLFGPLLFPLVSLSVAIILFEGGLSLRFSEIQATRRVLRVLVTVGALVTWAVASAAGYYLAGLNVDLAVLLGAILVVTGPTVIGPLLRFVRPRGPVGPLLKWEGIVIDPIGATLAVLTFEAIQTIRLEEVLPLILWGMLKTVLIGTGFGLLGAGFLVLLIGRNYVAPHLQNPFALALVLGAFVGSNQLQPESGLLTVTVMGIALANQNRVSVQHLVEFKENLRVLLLSCIFILLAARIQIAQLRSIGVPDLLFLIALIGVARPLSVLASTLRSRLSWKERVFLMWMAPRGIVAASVSAVFAAYLVERGVPGASRLVTLTFLVVIGTVAFYGLTALPVARLLGLAERRPQGVLFVGAHDWARAIAAELHRNDVPVLLVDTNAGNLAEAREEGLPAHAGDAASEQVRNEVDLEGIGRLLAMTSNEEVNADAALAFRDVFGADKVYTLPWRPESLERGEGGAGGEDVGRHLFGPEYHFEELGRLFAEGAAVVSLPLSADGDTAGDLPGGIPDNAVPLFAVSAAGEVHVFTADPEPSAAPPRGGGVLIALLPEPQARVQSDG